MENGETVIRLNDNGPYLVEGPVKLVDAEGTAFEVNRPKIWLCRCGQSANKPFCDGTHKKVDFAAASRAPRPEGDAEEGPERA